MEYWKPRTLFSNARAIGTPLSLDDYMLARSFFCKNSGRRGSSVWSVVANYGGEKSLCLGG